MLTLSLLNHTLKGLCQCYNRGYQRDGIHTPIRFSSVHLEPLTRLKKMVPVTILNGKPTQVVESSRDTLYSPVEMQFNRTDLAQRFRVLKYLGIYSHLSSYLSIGECLHMYVVCLGALRTYLEWNQTFLKLERTQSLILHVISSMHRVSLQSYRHI